jgi:hypothetical protein
MTDSTKSNIGENIITKHENTITIATCCHVMEPTHALNVFLCRRLYKETKMTPRIIVCCAVEYVNRESICFNEYMVQKPLFAPTGCTLLSITSATDQLEELVHAVKFEKGLFFPWRK